MVRQGNSAHYPCATWPILRHRTVGARSLQVANAQAAGRRLVSKSYAYFQRRNRRGSPRNMGSSDFFHVSAAPRPHRNSYSYLAPHAECARIRCLNRPKSSLEDDILWKIVQHVAADEADNANRAEIIDAIKSIDIS